MSSQPIDPRDLTARARIREAALDLFGRVGYERATTRAIADAAGVTSGLIRHHFGSKANLLAACDERLIEVFEELESDAASLPAGGYSPMQRLDRYGPYLARALFEGRGVRVFEYVRAGVESWLRSLPENADRIAPIEDEAAVRAAMALAVTLLEAQVSTAIGEDVRAPTGERRLLAALLQIYAQPLLTPEQAKAYHAQLEQAPLRAATDEKGQPR